MKILMLQHATWSRHYGGSRVQVELSEELRRQRHTVEKWSVEEAYPPGSFGYRWPRWGVNHFTFSRRALRFLRREARRFDVIDALQGNVPFPKSAFGFRGLLVCRSVGLQSIYERQLQAVDAAAPRAGHPLANLARTWLAQRDRPLGQQSLDHADLINVCNADELTSVRPRQAVCLPFGFTENRLTACAETASAATTRRTAGTVVFLGLWIRRKGSHQLGDIIRRIASRRPETRFKLLGVGGFPLQSIHADLGEVPLDRIEIVSSYRSEELPSLLRDCTAGVFPSFVEGFPFAVLEKLGCGVPTIGYDVPGARELLRPLDLIVEPGAVVRLADRVLDLLALGEDDYLTLVRRCHDLAAGFRWAQIARDTTRIYGEELDRIA